MKRLQHARLLAFILIGVIWIGSVGMTSYAAEADTSVSTDIILPEEESPEGETETELTASPEEEEASGESADAQESESGEAAGTEQDGSGSDPDAGQGQKSEENSDTASEDDPVSDTAAMQEPETETSGEAASGTEGADSEEEQAEAGTGGNAVTEEESGTGSDNADEAEQESDETADDENAESAEGSEGATTAQEACAETESETVTDFAIAFKQTDNPIVLSEGASKTLTAQISFTTNSEESAGRVAESIVWSSSSSKVAGIKLKDPVIKETVTQETSGGDGDSAGQEQTAVLRKVTITQNVVVTAVKEGSAKITVTAEGKTCVKKVTVNPIPVQLGKSSNLRWTSTTVLNWNAVKNTTKYKVIVYLVNGTKKYSKSVTVSGRVSYDLEDCIVALIKANKSSLKGAAYTISASVQALTTNSRYYKNGTAVKSPDLRYLLTTYQDAVSRNGWYLRSGSWYYYSAGKKQTGWVTFRNRKYYLDADGKMKKDCWVGKRYLKSGGEMAKSEWVDGYKYYVDANGLRVDKAALGTTNWVKTAKGWRFKKKDGTYAKSMWVSMNRAKYYFDGNGYLKTGWLTLNGKRYFLNNTGTISTGRGIPKTGWAKIGNYYYWFDSDGVMAKSQWVDRNQYYVNAAGHRLSWITYGSLKNVSTSNRLGQYIYSSGSAPEQSIAGYDEAYKNGNRIMVIDLRFTKDGVPVCSHDDLVGYARFSNGSKPGNKPSVSKLTLKELNKYDYGIYRGKKYKGTQILTLEEMAKWVKSHTDTEMYIEVKTTGLSAAQIKKTASILSKYGITDRSSAIFSVTKTSDTRAKRMHNAAPALRIGITTSMVGTLAYSQLNSAKGTLNEVFLWCWTTTKLSASSVSRLRTMNVQYECGTLDKFDDIISYYAKGTAYTYNTGIETDGAVFHSLLKEITCHNKAKWVSTSKGWKYLQIDGTYARSKWLLISGKYYHFDQNGLMQTGWLNLGGKLYYLNSKGARVTGTVTIAKHKYLFGDNGVMIKKIS